MGSTVYWVSEENKSVAFVVLYQHIFGGSSFVSSFVELAAAELAATSVELAATKSSSISNSRQQ